MQAELTSKAGTSSSSARATLQASAGDVVSATEVPAITMPMSDAIDAGARDRHLRRAAPESACV